MATIYVPITLPTGDHPFVVDGPSLSILGGLSGAGGFTKTGLGGLNVGDNSSYDGATVVQQGVLEGRKFGTTTSGTTVAAGASLELYSAVSEPLSLAGAGIDLPAGALICFPCTVDAPVSLNGEVRVTGAGATFSGPITGSGSLRLQTTGTPSSGYHFSGANTFSGGLNATTDVVDGHGSQAFGTGPVEMGVIATLELHDGDNFPNTVTLSGDGDFRPGIHLSSGTATIGGLTLHTTSWTYGREQPVMIDSGAVMVVSGSVDGAGVLSKTGLGTLALTGAGAVRRTGRTDVHDGTIVSDGSPGSAVLADTNVLPSQSPGASSVLALASDDQFAHSATLGGDVSGVIDFLGTNQQLQNISASADIYLGLTDDAGTRTYSSITLGGLWIEGARLNVLAGKDVSAAVADRITAGTVDVDGATLAIDVAPDMPTFQPVVLFDNLGSGAVVGTFDGLPQGAIFDASSGGARLEISYVGGNGNDITITRVPTDWPPPPPPPPLRSGYWMLGCDGAVYAFGDAADLGRYSTSCDGSFGAVHIAPTPDFNGYWIVNKRGTVSAHGDAHWAGHEPRMRSGEFVTSLSGTPSGFGYWLFTNQGRAIPYGDAEYFGDMGGTRLNGPVLDSVATPSGHGYYMIASDGGVFTFGDAVFHGSMGSTRLNKPVVGLAPDPDGVGYWLVASDGGIFAFDASFHGSMGSARLNKPMIGMVSYGDGYLMVAADGGIFDFSSKPFRGSLGSNPPANPIVGVAALNR